MSLGRYDAAVTPSFIEGLTLEGPIGHAGKKQKECLFAQLSQTPVIAIMKVH